MKGRGFDISTQNDVLEIEIEKMKNSKEIEKVINNGKMVGIRVSK